MKVDLLRDSREQAAARIFLHLAVVTAIFVIVEIQFIPRFVGGAIGLTVAVLGILCFGAKTHPLLWVFPAAMLATALWSTAPVFTAVSVGAIAVPVLLAGIVAQICGPQRFIKTLTYWSRVALIISFAVFLLMPTIGAHQDVLWSGAMRGLFAHKNGLSRLLVIGVFSELFVVQRRSSRAFWIVGFLVAAFLTRSLSFFFLTAAIVLVVSVFRSVNWGDRRSVGLFIGFAPIVGAPLLVLGVTLLPDLVERSGRFSAEDDRGRIWRGALMLFEQKPWGGWGYGQGFRVETPAGDLLTWAIGWLPSAAHSGYVGALVEGGWLGFLALAVTFLVFLRITWRVKEALLWPFVYTLVLMINNLTDSRSSSIEWFILSAGVLYAVGQNRGDFYLLPASAEPVTGATKSSAKLRMWSPQSSCSPS